MKKVLIFAWLFSAGMIFLAFWVALVILPVFGIYAGGDDTDKSSTTTTRLTDTITLTTSSTTTTTDGDSTDEDKIK